MPVLIEYTCTDLVEGSEGLDLVPLISSQKTSAGCILIVIFPFEINLANVEMRPDNHHKVTRLRYNAVKY